MVSDFLFVLCWIVLVLSGAAMLIGVAVGAAYHPENGLRNLSVLVLAVVLLGGLLVALRRATGAAALVSICLGILAGLALAGGFGYLMMSDPGDALLYVSPFALGLGFLGMVFLGGPHRFSRGDT